MVSLSDFKFGIRKLIHTVLLVDEVDLLNRF